MSGAGRASMTPVLDVRLLIVDDHRAVAEALRVALAAVADFEVVGVCNDVADAVATAAAVSPDVIVLDFRLPDSSGPDAIERLLRAAPEARVVVLTGSGGDQALLAALDAGATGFVTKQQPFAQVIAAIREAVAGRAAIDAAMLGRVLPQLRNDPAVRLRLTRRERDVLELIATGSTNAQVADALEIAVNTVRNHLARVFEKLGARSRGEAVAIASAQGLIATPGERLLP
jgi:DNA-binding NarL/FixJ family response regulator